MIDNIDISLVNWSRAQFAMTAMYHWIFVPLTLGLTYIIAIMETVYVVTGKEEWKRITKFWMTLFGINFAIGVATGIILEFEFGTNWSNYSWFVGDIFGAPLAIEGIMAFFLESTFIAVMFFGWNRVSKKFHLLSSWLVAIGASLSAFWILVANAWMQYPVGTTFNPETARNEMLNFWEVISPLAVNKFFHTILSGHVVSALFIICVSSWYLLKNREIWLAKTSIRVASIFGLVASLLLAWSGHGSAYYVAQHQPAKFAAMEGLYEGQKGAGLIIVGALNPEKEILDEKDPFLFKLEIPKLLSFLGFNDMDAFVPGINDLVSGNEEQNIMSASDKIAKGKIARKALSEYKKAKSENDSEMKSKWLEEFKSNFNYFGYGFLNDPKSIIPNVPMTFYSFHIMVGLGFYFIGLFGLMLLLLHKDIIQDKKWLLYIVMFTFPLGMIASQAGWIVAEVGRQPWVIQDLMPTMIATSNIDATAVMTTFFLFVTLFTILLIAEIKIMISQIKTGPKGE